MARSGERHRAKRKMGEKKIKKKRRSGALLAQSGGEIGGGGDWQLLDNDKNKKKKIAGLEEEVEKLEFRQSGGEIGGGGSKCQRLHNDKNKMKKIECLEELEKLRIRLTGVSPDERDIVESREIGGGSKCYRCKRKSDILKRADQYIYEEENSYESFEEEEFIFQCGLAEKALELYKEREGVEFEVVEPLCLESAYLRMRGAGLKLIHSWAHMSFTAKPKNNICNCNEEASSLEYFFAELVRDDDTSEYIAVYCSTFEPCKDEGNNAHGCSVCPLKVKFHPGPNGYVVGHPPYCKFG